MSSTGPHPAVVVRDLAAGKGRENAFAGLDFELPAASFTALVGGNGSGKTTLFEALLGLVEARSGSAEVLGRRPGPARPHVAYVPQASRLLHDGQFSGREFVACAFRAGRWGITGNRREAAWAVDYALDCVDGRHLARRPLAELSGGQRQRLLIAQALVNRPALVFMDEPLARLDPAAQQRIVGLSAHLRETLGIAVLFSTHDINPVADVADRVLYLAGGQGRIGAIDDVVTDDVLSALYGVAMHVVRERGRLFVMRDAGQPGEAARASHTDHEPMAPMARDGST